MLSSRRPGHEVYRPTYELGVSAALSQERARERKRYSSLAQHAHTDAHNGAHAPDTATSTGAHERKTIAGNVSIALTPPTDISDFSKLSEINVASATSSAVRSNGSPRSNITSTSSSFQAVPILDLSVYSEAGVGTGAGAGDSASVLSTASLKANDSSVVSPPVPTTSSVSDGTGKSGGSLRISSSCNTDIASISANTKASAYVTATAFVGSPVYTDKRSLIWSHLPEPFVGQSCVRTPREDGNYFNYIRGKSVSAADNTNPSFVFSFRPGRAALVCVLIDSKVTALPKWMRAQGYRKIVEQSAAVQRAPGSNPSSVQQSNASRSDRSAGSSLNGSPRSFPGMNTEGLGLTELFYTAYGRAVDAGELVTIGSAPKNCANMLSVMVLPASSPIRDQVLSGDEERLAEAGCVITCCSVLFCSVLFCSVLFCSVLFCMGQLSSVPSCL